MQVAGLQMVSKKKNWSASQFSADSKNRLGVHVNP